MTNNTSPWNSLKTRVTLLTLVIFLFSIWSVAYYSSRILRKDIQQLLGEQQLSTATIVAAEINNQIDFRLRALEKVAEAIAPAMRADSQELQDLLEARPILKALFNGGFFVVGLDGTALASVPLSVQRAGLNYMERDYIVNALTEGKSTVGKPIIGKVYYKPVLPMGVPVRNSAGTIVGALGGVTDLMIDNFLDEITSNRYGKTGDYLVVTPQHRLVVTSSDKKRIMQQLPAPGVNPQIDRNIAGYEGFTVLIDPFGVEQLAAMKKIPAAGWYLAVVMTTEEAFAPIKQMQKRLHLAALLLVLGAGGLIWWVVRRQLAPIQAAVETLYSHTDSALPLAPLPITRMDEVGQLIGAFNRSLEVIAQREATLRESEERHRSILKTAPSGILFCDSQGRIIEVNDFYLCMSGYGQQELQAMNLADLDLHWSTTSASEELQAIKKLGMLRFETQHQRRDGSCFDVEVSIQYRPTASGEYLAFIQDISERKQSEAFLKMGRAVLKILNEPGDLDDLVKQALVALKEFSGFDAVGIRLQDDDDFPYFSQEGFSVDFLLKENSLIERTRDGGISLDKDGNVFLQCICGLVVTGQTDPSLTLFTHGGSFWTNDSLLLLDLPEGDDPRLRLRKECVHLGYASVALVPIRSKDKILGLIQFNDHRKDCFTLETVEFLEGIGMHIGAAIMRKRIEVEGLLLEQQFQQTQKLEGLGVLASGIAHDFNNILAIIIGSCFLSRDHAEETGKSLVRIEAAAERGAELCRQMLAYAGKNQSAQTQVDVGLLADEIVRMLQSSIQKNVTIKLDAPSTLLYVIGDNSQLSQVIMNLIINAAEAIGDAQGEIRVRLEEVCCGGEGTQKDCLGKEIPTGNYLCLDVADNGCGMSDEVKRRLFEPFYTTKFSGRGLGLSATLGIITGHQGALQLSSQMGIGSTFKVYLPLKAGNAAVDDRSSQLQSAPWRGSGTILLVDDEDAILLAVGAMLKSLGFTVLKASDGREALELYQEHAATIDLVVSDMGMPVMNGYELIAALKKINPNLSVIIASGFGETELEVDTGEVAAFLSKPYNIEQLRMVLKDVTERLLPSRDYRTTAMNEERQHG